MTDYTSETGSRISGSAYADELAGTAGNDTIVGGGDNDTIKGGAGNDKILGDGNTGTTTGGDTVSVDFDGAFTFASGSHVNIPSSTYGPLHCADVSSSQVSNLVITAANDADPTVLDAGEIISFSFTNQWGQTVTVENAVVGQSAFANGADTGVLTAVGEFNGQPIALLINLNDSHIAAGQNFFANDDYADKAAGFESSVELSGLTGDGTPVPDVAGDDLIYAGDGDDTVKGGDGDDSVHGDAGNDTLFGQAGNDWIGGGDGHDEIFGGEGNDDLAGDAGNDSLNGDAGNDFITGDAGDDWIGGDEGDDTISGGDGNDDIVGDAGNDSISGDAGSDTISGGEGHDVIDGGAGDDILNGNGGNDTISTGDGSDTVNGGLGDDLIIVGAGGGTISGGEGNDTADFSGLDGAIFDEDAGTVTAGDDTYALDGIENVVGADVPDPDNSGDDNIVGTPDQDSLDGGDGNDTITGGGDDDTINGGAGDDCIDGDGNTGGGSVVIQDFIVNGSFEQVADGSGDPTMVSTFNSNGDDVQDRTEVGFYEAIPGWATDFESIEIHGDQTGIANSLAAHDGNFKLEIDGGADYPFDTNMNVHQNVAGMLDGQDYDLTFHMQNRDGDAGDVVTVLFGGEVVDVIEQTSTDYEEYNFTVQGGQGDGSDRLEFQINVCEEHAIFIDSVSLVGPANEPVEDVPGGDLINGGAGADKIDGGAGDDTINGDDNSRAEEAEEFCAEATVQNFADNGVTLTATSLDGSPATVSEDADGIGVIGGDPVPGQINHEETGDSEILTAAFEAPVESAEITVTRLIPNENGGEVGQWRALDADGNEVGTGTFGPEVITTDHDLGSTPGVGIFTIEGIGEFSSIEFSALPYVNGTPDGSDDSSDYYLYKIKGEYPAGHNCEPGFNDTLIGGDGNDDIAAGGGDDEVFGGTGNDLLDGGHGDDLLNGGDGNDTISGDSGMTGGVIETDIAQGLNGTYDIDGVDGIDVTMDFLGGSAAFHNTFGFYLADSNGDPISGEIVKADVKTSDAAAGADVISFNLSAAQLAGAAQLGFFLIPNGGTLNPTLADGDAVTFVDDGNGELQAQVDGVPVLAQSPHGPVFFSGQDLNGDGLDHEVDNALAGNSNWEDLENGGDNDFNDVNWQIDVTTQTPKTFDDTINAGAGDDVVTADAGDDVVNGDDGNDDLSGGDGNDTVNGGSGADSMNGDAGDDVMDGGDGNDWMGGDDGDDILNGGLGDDDMVGDAGNDTMNGGDGNDFMDGGSDDDLMDGDAGDDDMRGGDGNDSMNGDLGCDTLVGGAGDDTLRGDFGADVLDGGDGIDTADYSQAQGTVLVSLKDGIAEKDGDGWVDSLENIENLEGSAHADLLIGDAGDNVINGGDGDDTIEGFGGDDTLDGGAGINTISFSGAIDGIVAALQNNRAVVDGVESDLINFDNVVGGDGDDSITGDDGDNTLIGGGGNDDIRGLEGNDLLIGDGQSSSAGDTDTLIVYAHGSPLDGVFPVMEVSVGGVVVGTTSVTQSLDGYEFDISGLSETERAGEVKVTMLNDATDGGDCDNSFGPDGNEDRNLFVEAIEFNGGITDASEGTLTFDPAQFVSYQSGANNFNITDIKKEVNDSPGLPNGGNIYHGSVIFAGLPLFIPAAGPNDDFLAGNEGDDTMIGGVGNDTVFGGDGDDCMEGNEDDDLVCGFAGEDKVFGGAGNDTVEGNIGNDTVFGGSGNDIANGSEGNDTVFGDEGEDTVSGGDGNDIVFGGLGNDSVTGDFGDDEVFGDEGDDTLRGNAGNDTVAGGVGNDSILGEGGNDVLSGDEGNDTVKGGAGTDLLSGGLGADFLDGGVDNDTLLGEDGGDILRGGDGADELDGGIGVDVVKGDDGDDIARGGADNDFVDGGNGNDQVFGGDGNDSAFGGNGDDTVDGGAGDDTVRGNAGIDSVHGGLGNDFIETGTDDDIGHGDEGNDTIRGDGGVDQLFGGDGEDVLRGGDLGDSLFGGADNDFIVADGGDDLAEGGDGNDSLRGFAGDDTLIGGLGDDNLRGNNGNDSLEGNDGNDFADGEDGDDFVSGGLGNDVLRGNDGSDTIEGGGGNDQLRGGLDGDELFGGAGDDFINADGGADLVFGGDGVDDLFGAGGNDTIDGGAGNDKVKGDAGADNLDGGAGDDQVLGGDGNDLIFGSDGNDDLRGNVGFDTLDGGNGSDTLLGGANQKDTYEFGRRTDLNANDDLITDAGEGNVLNVNGVNLLAELDFTQTGVETVNVAFIDGAGSITFDIDTVTEMNLVGAVTQELGFSQNGTDIDVLDELGNVLFTI